MEPFLVIVFTLLFLTGAAIALFLLTVHPVWAIIDVAVSPNKSSGEKVLWIVLMFVLWTLGSVLYGFIFATRPLAVTTRVLVSILLALILVLVTIAIVAPMTVDRLRGSIPHTRIEQFPGWERMHGA